MALCVQGHISFTCVGTDKQVWHYLQRNGSPMFRQPLALSWFFPWKYQPITPRGKCNVKWFHKHFLMESYLQQWYISKETLLTSSGGKRRHFYRKKKPKKTPQPRPRYYWKKPPYLILCNVSTSYINRKKEREAYKNTLCHTGHI